MRVSAPAMSPTPARPCFASRYFNSGASATHTLSSSCGWACRRMDGVGLEQSWLVGDAVEQEGNERHPSLRAGLHRPCGTQSA